MKTLQGLLTAVCLVAAGGSVHAQSAILAIVDAAVVDVEMGAIRRTETVIIQSGRIVAVGARDRTPVPAEAIRIDARGKYLVPGFSDMHVHLYTEGDAFTYLANGITTIRNMAGDASHLAFKKRTAEGQMIGPRIITAGPVIETKLSHPDNALVGTAEEARREVFRQHQAGYDFIKVYNDITPDVYRAVMAAARELKMPVAGHIPDAIGLREALASGQASIEHLRGYPYELLPAKVRRRSVSPQYDERTLAWNAIDAAGIDKIARDTAAAGVWNCPTFTFTVHELSPKRTHEALLRREETAWLSLSGLPKDRTKGYLAGFTEADFAGAQWGLANRFRLLRALDKAGAGLLVGTDSWLSRYALADEMELMVKAGFRPARVLRMATLDTAKFLDESEERGSIRAGKVADLVLLDADPLQRVGNVRKVAGVIKEGRYIDRADIDRRIDQLKRLKAKL